MPRIRKALTFLAAPFEPSPEVHNKEDRTSDYHGPTACHYAKSDPARTRHHKDKKAVLILVTEQKDSGQTAKCRKPIDPVKLEKGHFFAAIA